MAGVFLFRKGLASGLNARQNRMNKSIFMGEVRDTEREELVQVR